MQVEYLAVSLLLLGGVKSPEPQVIHQGIYDKAGCEQWKKTMVEAKTGFIDPGTGRPVLNRQFICQPVDLDDLQKMLDRARKG